MRLTASLAICAAALFAIGCGGAEWRVIKQATPNPFAGRAAFEVLPVDYTGLHVGPMAEDDYLAQKGAETQESFEGDKDGINEKFVAALVAHANEQGLSVKESKGKVTAPFLIRPHVAFIEPGSPLAGMGPNSEVRMRVTIETAEGKKLDVIELSHETAAMTWGQISSGQRLREDADAIGEALATYLMKRTDG